MGTATLLITATVQSGSPATNTASISAPGVSDPNAANNTASATVTPAQQADIAVTKTVNTPNPVIGSNVIFTLTATNNGPAAATNIQVTDLLPTGFTFVSALASQGTYTSSTGVWAVPSLAVSANATLQITASVRPSGVYSNTATRTASTPVGHQRRQRQRHRDGQPDLRHRADHRRPAGRRRAHDQRRRRDSRRGAGGRRHRDARHQPHRSGEPLRRPP